MTEKRLFTIVENTPVADKTFRLVLKAVGPDYVFSGEFVDIAIEGFYLRRPLSVFDCGPGTISILYKVVGEGTAVLAGKPEGSTLELLTGLGKGYDASATGNAALLVAGGLGAAPLYMVCKELKAAGKKVSVVLGFNKADEIVLEKEFRELADNVGIATLDGSVGIKGFVTDAIAQMNPEYDFFYTCGPMVMMKAVCAALKTGGQASLEERMGCGAGFCYGCSCRTMVGTKRICMDGPVFNKEEIIW